MQIGVLALQGAFREHGQMLATCGCDSVEVRKPEQLEQVQGLIIPGGESTTIGKLMVDYRLMDEIKKKVAQGMPVFGTCAGAILLAREIEDSDQPRLGLMDIKVRRNAYGRQRESFEVDLTIDALGRKPFRAVFIRAPQIIEVKPAVGIMATHADQVVLCRQGNFLAATFHPELTGDNRIHRYFIKMVKDAQRNVFLNQ